MDDEGFLPGYEGLADSIISECPECPFTPLSMFVCTYVGCVSNLRMSPQDLSVLMCNSLGGPLIAFNSNYKHACQPGYEYLIKTPKTAVVSTVPSRSKPRKEQGDGTCFNSAVEPTFRIEHPDITPDKIYKVKCFPTTGETQIPGVVCSDLSDGHAVLATFVDHLNAIGAGASGPGGEVLPVAVVRESPKMLNYKFRLVRKSPRVLVNLIKLAEYLGDLESAGVALENEKRPTERLLAWPSVVVPPYPIKETKPPTDDVKVSFRFCIGSRSPRVNVFQEGKINVLGAETSESAEGIYKFFCDMFVANWCALVALLPRRDYEPVRPKRRVAPPARSLRAASPPGRRAGSRSGAGSGIPPMTTEALLEALSLGD